MERPSLAPKYFRIYRSTTSGFTPVEAQATFTVNGTQTAYRDQRRPAGTYHYLVVAENAAVSRARRRAQVSATVEDVVPSTFIVNPRGEAPTEWYPDGNDVWAA